MYDGGDEVPQEPTQTAAEATRAANPEYEAGFDDGKLFEIGEDETETQQVFQDDLNELYTGKLMEVFYPYSWFFTNLLIYYMYSGGMPIMYPVSYTHLTLPTILRV